MAKKNLDKIDSVPVVAVDKPASYQIGRITFGELSFMSQWNDLFPDSENLYRTSLDEGNALHDAKPKGTIDHLLAGAIEVNINEGFSSGRKETPGYALARYALRDQIVTILLNPDSPERMDGCPSGELIHRYDNLEHTVKSMDFLKNSFITNNDGRIYFGNGMNDKLSNDSVTLQNYLEVMSQAMATKYAADCEEPFQSLRNDMFLHLIGFADEAYDRGYMELAKQAYSIVFDNFPGTYKALREVGYSPLEIKGLKDRKDNIE